MTTASHEMGGTDFSQTHSIPQSLLATSGTCVCVPVMAWCFSMKNIHYVGVSRLSLWNDQNYGSESQNAIV
jgi:hypothetical protein